MINITKPNTLTIADYANTTLANQQTQPSFRNSGFLKTQLEELNLKKLMAFL